MNQLAIFLLTIEPNQQVLLNRARSQGLPEQQIREIQQVLQGIMVYGITAIDNR